VCGRWKSGGFAILKKSIVREAAWFVKEDDPSGTPSSKNLRSRSDPDQYAAAAACHPARCAISSSRFKTPAIVFSVPQIIRLANLSRMFRLRQTTAPRSWFLIMLGGKPLPYSRYHYSSVTRRLETSLLPPLYHLNKQIPYRLGNMLRMS